MSIKSAAPAVIAIAIFASASAGCAKDPCQSLLCMTGKVQGGVIGNGSIKDGCAQGIADFASIIKMRDGRMDRAATADARRAYLNSCGDAASNAAAIDEIISRFGTATLEAVPGRDRQ
ncbi:hypothetical protein [Pandoraea sputorum]|uniref:hypothetical protein n=1 Tax=Pandoraea sputorum TaxID=93222 RepID=UPI0012409FF3|nr:hypothetical protein [Pandoraea sputorum]